MSNSTGPAHKIHPYTSTLDISTDGGSTYAVNVLELMLLTPPDLQRDEAKVTVIDSPLMAEEVIASWIKLGEVPIEVFYTDAGAMYNTLLGYFLDGISRYCKIKIPKLTGQTNNAQFVLQGFINKLKLSEAKAGDNNAYSCPAAIRIATGTGFAFTPAS